MANEVKFKGDMRITYEDKNSEGGSILRYVGDDGQFHYISSSLSKNSASIPAMSTSDIATGTSTTAMSIAPKTLRDNFYTEGEIDTMIGNIETLLAEI